MPTSSRTPLPTLVLWALAWAAAMIVSAIVLKGHPIKDWVQSVLFVAAMTFWLWQTQRAAKR
jgi:membrane-associated phospholipid phosphatase